MENLRLNKLEYTITAWPANGLPATLAERTRRIYDRLAPVYSISTRLFHSNAHRRALEISEIRDGMQVSPAGPARLTSGQ